MFLSEHKQIVMWNIYLISSLCARPALFSKAEKLYFESEISVNYDSLGSVAFNDVKKKT